MGLELRIPHLGSEKVILWDWQKHKFILIQIKKYIKFYVAQLCADFTTMKKESALMELKGENKRLYVNAARGVAGGATGLPNPSWDTGNQGRLLQGSAI